MTFPQKPAKSCRNCGNFSNFDWGMIKDHIMRDPSTAVVLTEFSRIYTMAGTGRCRAEKSTRPNGDWCTRWIPATGDVPMWPKDNDELQAGFSFVVPKE